MAGSEVVKEGGYHYVSVYPNSLVGISCLYRTKPCHFTTDSVEIPALYNSLLHLHHSGVVENSLRTCKRHGKGVGADD